MTFTDSIQTCLQKYVTFSGRASRPEYWWFVLFNVLGTFVAGILDSLFFGSSNVGVLGGLWSLALLLPGISVGVRRLHDLDKSGWWLLLGVIPLIGWIILIVWFVGRGTNGPNRFGAAPVLEAAAR
ncbi:DUF805 domain-containing protein [Tropicimonas sp. IMCC34043]|uniref:DUF805 domain-containing protein n=1 Tax=Tropicimonas sp. IMCC34043 TaxID=2248760 RepID=UPI000E26BE12|nr:DUF805 domain-containing protein [Tropicimonas sp. IMCC34043]